LISECKFRYDCGGVPYISRPHRQLQRGESPGSRSHEELTGHHTRNTDKNWSKNLRYMLKVFHYVIFKVTMLLIDQHIAVPGTANLKATRDNIQAFCLARPRRHLNLTI